jgi:AraC-like DNA-binding protein
MKHEEPTVKEPGFFSTRVEDAGYFHLNLTPAGRDPLAIVCGGRERCRPDYQVRRQDFRYACIEYVAEGAGEFVLAGRRHALRAGVAFSYGPGVAHRIRTDPANPMTKYFVDFTGREAASLLQAASLGRAPVQVSDPVRVRAVFDDLLESGRTGSAAGARICLLLLRLLVARIAELAVTGPAADERALHSYRRCKSHIDRHCIALRRLDEVARACHMDPAYVCRLFKRFGSTTPYRYLVRQKMNRAAELLQDPDMLVKQVADELGFTDPFHFSRSFKKVYGIPPEQFATLSRRR